MATEYPNRIEDSIGVTPAGTLDGAWRGAYVNPVLVDSKPRVYDFKYGDKNVSATYTGLIYLAGPIEEAKQIIRREVLKEPLCVSIQPLHYIYPGAEETGYIVRVINYPRFPVEDLNPLVARTVELAKVLMSATYQRSCTIEWPDRSVYLENPAYNRKD